MNSLCINIDAYVSFNWHLFVYRCVTGPSVQRLHDNTDLPAPQKWSCLVRKTLKGWGQELSGNAALCVLFVKINHLDKDIWREFISNSCNSKLLCAGWWCNRTTPRVWIWSSSRIRGWRNHRRLKERVMMGGKTEDSSSVCRNPPADRFKWGDSILRWHEQGCTGKSPNK